MSWRDFLYFSKGERSGLIVLLCLIAIAGILLIWDNKTKSVNEVVIQKKSDINVISTKEEYPVDQSLDKQTTTESSSIKNDKNLDSTRSNRNVSKNIQITNANESEEQTLNEPNEKPNNKESVSERVNRLTSYSRQAYSKIEKYKEGTIVELNTADTTTLKKVPGIGSAFAKRIVSYRNLLGGYYSVIQLSEVYGIDEERYNSLVKWFSTDPLQISRLEVNRLSQDSLQRHPYIDYEQAKVIIQLRKQKGKISGWENLQLLNEFTDSDKMRLLHYLSFE